MPTIDMMATGKNIRKIMDDQQMSVATLQGIFGFGTPQAIYKWVQGKALPSIDNLVILASVLGVSIDCLIITTK